MEAFVPLGQVKIDSSGLPNRLKISVVETDNISLVGGREESDYSLPSCMTMEHYHNISLSSHFTIDIVTGFVIPLGCVAKSNSFKECDTEYRLWQMMPSVRKY